MSRCNLCSIRALRQLDHGTHHTKAHESSRQCDCFQGAWLQRLARSRRTIHFDEGSGPSPRRCDGLLCWAWSAGRCRGKWPAVVHLILWGNYVCTGWGRLFCSTRTKAKVDRQVRGRGASSGKSLAAPQPLQLFGEARPRHSASCCQVAVAITYLCLPGLIVTMTILQCYPIVPHLTGKGVHGFIKDATPSLLGDADEVAVLCVAGVALRARPCQDTLELVNWEAFAYLQLCHMELFHPQLFHTQLLQTHRCHTQVFHTHLLHTQLFPHHSFTHNSVTHTHTPLEHATLSDTTLSHTHTSWTHYSFRHNSVTHTPLNTLLFQAQLCHTGTHTHTSWTQYSFRHNSVTRTHYSFRRNSVTHTHTLEHATLSGATLSHRHTHTPLEHNTLLDTTLSHTHTHLLNTLLFQTQLCHTHTHPLNTPLFQTQPCHTHTHLLNTQLCHTHTRTPLEHKTLSHTTLLHTHTTISSTTLSDTTLWHPTLSHTTLSVRFLWHTILSQTFTYNSCKQPVLHHLLCFSCLSHLTFSSELTSPKDQSKEFAKFCDEKWLLTNACHMNHMEVSKVMGIPQIIQDWPF